MTMKINFFLNICILAILNAKSYNKCIDAHKIMSEVMRRLHWEQFDRWIKLEDYEFRLEPLNIALEELLTDMAHISISKHVDSDKLQV